MSEGKQDGELLRELEAIENVFNSIASLDSNAAGRVCRYAVERHERFASVKLRRDSYCDVFTGDIYEHDIGPQDAAVLVNPVPPTVPMQEHVFADSSAASLVGSGLHRDDIFDR